MASAEATGHVLYIAICYDILLYWAPSFTVSAELQKQWVSGFARWMLSFEECRHTKQAPNIYALFFFVLPVWPSVGTRLLYAGDCESIGEAKLRLGGP